MDEILKKHIKVLCDDLKQDDDSLVIIFGDEGTGKSVLESQVVKEAITELKCNFSIANDVHYFGKNYIKSSLNNPSLSINCLDESRRTLNKMRMMSSNNQEFMNFLSECRSQNQLHIILLPSYFDLDPDVAIRRCKLVIKVIKRRHPKTKRIIRGIFQIIRTDNKNLLRELYKYKPENIPSKYIAYEGKFSKEWGWDEEEYRNKKEKEKAKNYLQEKEDKIKFTNKDHFVVNTLINYITSNRKMTEVFMGDVASYRGFERLRGKYREFNSNNNI